MSLQQWRGDGCLLKLICMKTLRHPTGKHIFIIIVNKSSLMQKAVIYVWLTTAGWFPADGWLTHSLSSCPLLWNEIINKRCVNHWRQGAYHRGDPMTNDRPWENAVGADKPSTHSSPRHSSGLDSRQQPDASSRRWGGGNEQSTSTGRVTGSNPKHTLQVLYFDLTDVLYEKKMITHWFMRSCAVGVLKPSFLFPPTARPAGTRFLETDFIHSLKDGVCSCSRLFPVSDSDVSVIH